jgi:hypothetical protein
MGSVLVDSLLNLLNYSLTLILKLIKNIENFSRVGSLGIGVNSAHPLGVVKPVCWGIASHQHPVVIDRIKTYKLNSQTSDVKQPLRQISQHCNQN